MNEQLNKELVEALIKSRCEFPDIPKTKTGRVGSHSYKYADLGDIIPLITPILNKNGLLLTQLLSSIDRQDDEVEDEEEEEVKEEEVKEEEEDEVIFEK